MRLQYLTLANFRGIKEKTIRLDGKNATIKGGNGTGKTTVANAISYLLTDSPATGEKDFTPKTEGEHNLNHVAEMGIVDDEGIEIIYSKDFHEVWKKKRGSQNPEFAGHEVTYEINHVPAKKKEYDADMERLCGGDAKRALILSNVGYFATTLPQADRRSILFDVCGDVSDDKVMETAGLTALKDILKMPGKTDQLYTPEEYLKIAKSRRADLNKKLDELPARIDELQRSLPEGADAEGWLLKAQGELKQLEQGKEGILTTSTDTKTEGLKAAIAGMKAEIEAGRERYLSEKNKATAAAEEATAGIRDELHRQEDTLRKLRTDASICSNKIKDMEMLRENLLQQFDNLKKKQWDPSKETCPTCGQTLPADAVKQLRENFLAGLALEKARINEEGKKCSKAAIEFTQKDLSLLIGAITGAEERIASLKEQLESKKPDNIQNYEETIDYKTTRGRLEELEEELKAAQTTNERPDTAEIDAKIEKLQEEIAARKAAEAIKARIEELEGEQQATSKALDSVDRGINMCEEFFRAKVGQVSKLIDSHFEKIRFRLFKDQINGGLKECCEPLVPDENGNLIEYKMANTAAQVNAGLEIIKVLSAHYGVYLPIIVDRAESVTDLMPMPDHQVIRLVVSAEDKELCVDKEEE